MTMSQKTLPVSLTILDFFPESMGEAGIIALPCILGHLCQTLIDSFLTTYFEAKSKEAKKPLAELADDDTADEREEGTIMKNVFS
eukprot:08973_6